jgi:replicative DNA helicase
MNDFIKVSPLNILEMTSRKGLGRGNLGVLMARAGVGKTACLIHIALDKIFRKEKLVHVSLEDMPEKVTSYYNVIYSDLLKALNISEDNESRILLERNRMILAYLNKSFEIARFRNNLKNLIENIEFTPDSIIVDGMDFEKVETDIFKGLRELASEFQVEIWFSALSHRHISEVNERGIPFPCNRMDEFLSIILQLQPTQSGVFISLLKDHDREIPDNARIRLDPNTFLVSP